MIVIHEFGHYTAGKLLGFDITEFSVGFGPKLLQKRLKNGEKFTLRAIPLGGYCAFVDEDGSESQAQNQSNQDNNSLAPTQATTPMTLTPFPEHSATTLPQTNPSTLDWAITNNAITPPSSDSPSPNDSILDTTTDNSNIRIQTTTKPLRSFVDHKPWKRLVVFVAGATFNFVSAILFAFIYIVIVGYAVPQVVDIYQNPDTGTAYNQAIHIGDQIIAINDRYFNVLNSYSDIITDIEKEWTESGKDIQKLKVEFTVLRNGENKRIKVCRQEITQTDQNGNPTTYYGFGFTNTSVNKTVSFGSAIISSIPLTLKFSWMILGSFGQMLTGAIGLNQMTGPISTIGTMAQVSQANPLNILILLPLIAANLAIFNLLPIPALDGSKVVFTTIEWIRGKPINRRIENIIHTIGLLFLLGFVILIEFLRVLT